MIDLDGAGNGRGPSLGCRQIAIITLDDIRVRRTLVPVQALAFVKLKEGVGPGRVDDHVVSRYPYFR